MNLAQSFSITICSKFRFPTNLLHARVTCLKKHLLCVPLNKESVDAVGAVIQLNTRGTVDWSVSLTLSLAGILLSHDFSLSPRLSRKVF